MHEMPFVLGLLQETDREARAQGWEKIRRIKVAVGELTGIEPGCVSLYFETVSEGHAAQGAQLEFQMEPALLVCGACGKEFPHDLPAARAAGRDPFCCPSCGGDGVLKKGTGTDTRLLLIEGE